MVTSETKKDYRRLYNKRIELDEKQIIEQLRGGDSSRLEWIVERYGRQVFTLCYRVVGDRFIAQELTQDAFLKVYDNINKWRGDCAFSTWLYRVAYNTAVSSTRRRKLATVNAEIPDVPDENYDAKREDKYVALEVAIEKLKVDERTIINMYYYDNKSVEELAYIIGMSQANVKTKLFRIRKKLADLMG